MPTPAITTDAMRRQHARNAVSLERDLDKARTSGRKVRGYRADQLAYYVTELRHLAKADDEELRARMSLGLLDAEEKVAFLGGVTFRQLLAWRNA
jgi:hypothetical protein